MAATFRLRGTIAFSQLTPDSPRAIEREGTRCQLRAPGIDLAWSAEVVDVANERGIVVFAAGRARGGASDAALGEAARWLRRYIERGEDAAADIGGGFAVAVVDCVARRVLLFVDRFAIETLCYRAGEDRVDFSDAARHVPGRHAIDPQAIYDYLYFHVVPAPQTIYRDVHRVPAGHAVSIAATSTRTHRYWIPTFVENDRSALAQRMREFVCLLETCVAEEADEPATACFLSGGTDSSTVAGMLGRVRGEPAHAYSIGFAARGYDEMAYARTAARHFGLVHREYYVTPDDLVGAIPSVAAALDQPFGNSSLLPAYFCGLRAREDGFSRMLAGDGGDELFGGNTRYAMQKMFELYHALPGALRSSVIEPMAQRSALFTRVPGLRRIGGYVRHAHVPMPDRLETFNLLRRCEEEMLEPSLRSRVDGQRPLAQQRETWNAIGPYHLVNRMLAYDWKFTLGDSDLPKVRAATQLAGINVGYPLLGRDLTDFSLRLPPDWKVKRHELRWFFKRALGDFLPAEIIAKKKHGFGLPFGNWMLGHTALRRLATDSLEAIAERGIVRRTFVRELVDTRLPSAPGYYGELVWILMMLEQWLRQAHDELRFDGPPLATSHDAPLEAQRNLA